MDTAHSAGDKVDALVDSIGDTRVSERLGVVLVAVHNLGELGWKRSAAERYHTLNLVLVDDRHNTRLNRNVDTRKQTPLAEVVEKIVIKEKLRDEELGSRVNLLENRVALVVPADNPRGIDGFDALAALLRDGEVLLAMGNSDVPVGQYTQIILKYYELDEEQLASAGKITYGSNVKEVTTQVVEGSVDCGVVYATDAFSAGLDVTDSATEEMCGRVVYPAAVMKNSISPDAARAFLDWLRGPEAMSVFE